MAESIVFRVRQESKGPIGALVFTWSIVQAISWVGILAHYPSHHAHTGWYWLWIWSNVFLGLVIGIRRRSGVIFTAPLVAGIFNVIPTYVGFVLMPHHGFLWGIVAATIYLVLFGWVVYAALQAGILFASASVARLLTAPFRRHSDVVIIGPDGRVSER